MANGEIVQGLLFILHEKKIEDLKDYHYRSQHEFPSGGYLLLPLVARTEKIVNLFSKYGVFVLASDQELSILDSAVKEGTVDVAEILLETVELPRGFTQYSFRFYTDESNETTLRRTISQDFDIRSEPPKLKREFRWKTDADSVKVLEKLLSHSADIHLRHREEGFLLHLAVSRDDQVLTELLLQKGANVHARTNMGRTVLNIAADLGHAEMVTLFLERGISVDVREKNGSTPLHLAARRGHTQVCEVLLAHGAAVNPSISASSAFRGGTPLLLGIDSGNAEVVSLLLKHGADINSPGYFGESYLQIAVENESPQIINILLDHGGVTASDPRNKSAFRVAIRKGSEKLKPILDRMTSNGFSVETEDAHDPTLLHGAVRLSCFSILEELLRQGADVNAISSGEQSRKTLLHTAVEHSTNDVIHLLLQHGANVNAECSLGRTPLFHAATSGDLDLADVLIKAGASLTTHDCKYNTILSSTCVHDLPDMVRLLLRNGANVNDRAPIVTASKLGLSKVVEVLCEFGANVDAKNEFYRTALNEAAARNFVDVVKILLRYGASMNISGDSNGRTAFLEAVAERCFEVVKLLSAFGALLNSSDATAEAAVVIAAKRDDRIFQYLLEYHFTDITPTLMQKFIRLFSGNLLDRWERDFFKDFILKLECIGYDVGEGCKKRTDSRYHISPQSCMDELNSLKVTHVNDTPWTYYDVLVKCLHRVAIFARNEAFVRTPGPDFYYRYPIYRKIIEYRIQRGRNRKDLIEQTGKIFPRLFSEFGVLPVELAESILEYLGDRDMLVLVTACTQKCHP